MFGRKTNIHDMGYEALAFIKQLVEGEILELVYHTHPSRWHVMLVA